MKLYLQMCEILIFKYSIFFSVLFFMCVYVCVFIFGFPYDQNSFTETWYKYVHKIYHFMEIRVSK